MAKIAMVFIPEKETKNTVKYNEKLIEGEVANIGVLYVQKTTVKALGNSFTDAIAVTIEGVAK